jgi:hypothetical protein
MMVSLGINRNRLLQVVNMKLYKMQKRKTDQDKYKSGHAQGHGKKNLDAEVSFTDYT